MFLFCSAELSPLWWLPPAMISFVLFGAAPFARRWTSYMSEQIVIAPVNDGEYVCETGPHVPVL